ncbi:kielin/chordin-like protein [Haliotis cracherodii]|uniref:kielin/chordin-like protein n=1 Tax=Haliotis cracherodii TaxID=6455 RepID=UPI0039E82F43
MSSTSTLTPVVSVVVVLTSVVAIRGMPKVTTWRRSCYEIDYDAIQIITNGTTWERRCHTCTCVDGEILCNGPSCALEYRPEFEYMCTKWTEDRCCCEHVGCVVDGVVIDLEAWYTRPDDSCTQCRCGVGFQQCRSTENCVSGAMNTY